MQLIPSWAAPLRSNNRYIFSIFPGYKEFGKMLKCKNLQIFVKNRGTLWANAFQIFYWGIKETGHAYLSTVLTL
jgi:hypothetical protein